MGFLEFLSDLPDVLGNIQPYEKPRRVFTRGLVAFCVLVAVLERDDAEPHLYARTYAVTAGKVVRARSAFWQDRWRE